eukprot:m.181399 g.181399  ORF g.181399 m.181399 type:complete len:228 (-) comp10474_c0_seq7:207-890(-)
MEPKALLPLHMSRSSTTRTHLLATMYRKTVCMVCAHQSSQSGFFPRIPSPPVLTPLCATVQREPAPPTPEPEVSEAASTPASAAASARPSIDVTIARALYPYNSPEFSFEVNDRLKVLTKVDENWWKVAHIDGSGRKGIAPVNYLEVEQGPAAIQAVPGSGTTRVVAQYSYTSQQEDDIAFEPGDEMTVLEEVDSNWIRVRKDGGGPRSEGLAPTNYVKYLEEATDA